MTNILKNPDWFEKIDILSWKAFRSIFKKLKSKHTMTEVAPLYRDLDFDQNNPYNRSRVIELFNEIKVPQNQIDALCDWFEKENKRWSNTIDDFFIYLTLESKKYPILDISGAISKVTDNTVDMVTDIRDLPWGSYGKNTVKYWGVTLVWATMLSSTYNMLTDASDTPIESGKKILQHDVNSWKLEPVKLTVDGMDIIFNTFTDSDIMGELSEKWILTLNQGWNIQRAMVKCAKELKRNNNFDGIPEVCDIAINELSNVLQPRIESIMPVLDKNTDLSSKQTARLINDYYKAAKDSLIHYNAHPEDSEARLDSLLRLTQLFGWVSRGQHYINTYESFEEKSEALRKIDTMINPLLASIKMKKTEV